MGKIGMISGSKVHLVSNL